MLSRGILTADDLNGFSEELRDRLAWVIQRREEFLAGGGEE